MKDIIASKAIMASFFTPPFFLDVVRDGAALLARSGVAPQVAEERVRQTLVDMLRRRAVECLPDGTLELHRERYPHSLRKDVCPDLGDLDVEDVGVGLYKPLEEFPEELRHFFEQMIARRTLESTVVDGRVAIPDGVFLPLIPEHARDPFIPLHLFFDHPLLDDVDRGDVVPVMRWNMPMVRYGDYIDYSFAGDAPDHWLDLEARASLGLV